MLANLTLKLFPSISIDFSHSGQVDLLPNHFLRYPLLQATEMKVTHGAITLASAEQRVGLCALRHPAELALPVGFLSVSLCVWNFLAGLSI